MDRQALVRGGHKPPALLGVRWPRLLPKLPRPGRHTEPARHSPSPIPETGSAGTRPSLLLTAGLPTGYESRRSVRGDAGPPAEYVTTQIEQALALNVLQPLLALGFQARLRLRACLGRGQIS